MTKKEVYVGMKFTNPHDERTREVTHLFNHKTWGLSVTIKCLDCICRTPFDIEMEDFIDRFKKGVFVVENISAKSDKKVKK